MAVSTGPTIQQLARFHCRARNGIARAIRNSPSLKNYPDNVLADAYADGRRQAEAETGLPKLPAGCPWPVEQMLKHDFWPES